MHQGAQQLEPELIFFGRSEPALAGCFRKAKKKKFCFCDKRKSDQFMKTNMIQKGFLLISTGNFFRSSKLRMLGPVLVEAVPVGDPICRLSIIRPPAPGPWTSGAGAEVAALQL